MILALDVIQHIYHGTLAIALKYKRYGLSCLFQEATGSEAHKSHFHGRDPIITIFGSGGLTIGNAMAYPYWYRVDDHSVFLMEIAAESLFGGTYPKIGSSASRTLITVRSPMSGTTTKHPQVSGSMEQYAQEAHVNQSS